MISSLMAAGSANGPSKRHTVCGQSHLASHVWERNRIGTSCRRIEMKRVNKYILTGAFTLAAASMVWAQSRPGGTGTPPGSGTQPPAGSGTTPPAGSGTQPPAGSGTQPPAGSGTRPPAGSGTVPPAGSGTQPPAGSGTTPPSGSGTMPPGANGQVAPRTGQPGAGVNIQGSMAAGTGQINQTPWFGNADVRSNLQLSSDQFNRLNSAYSNAWNTYNQGIGSLASNLTPADRMAQM